MLPTQPDFIDKPFAQNGARNDIPSTGGEDEGLASLDQGFPSITEMPLSQGGLPPRRKDFNGILYALSSFQFFAQAGGIFTYDASIDYRTPALVWHANNLYICVGNNGPSGTVVTPGTDTNYWKDFIEFLNLGSAGNVIAQKLGTSTIGSNTQGMWLNAGSPQAMTGTVGDESTGVWLKNGVITACTAGGGSGIADYKLAEAGYVKFEIGLIVQWGNRATTGSTKSGADNYTVTFPTKFTSGSSYVIVKNMKTPHGGGCNERDVSFWSKTASTAITRGSCSHYVEYTEQEEWLAIGY